jgi:hypothetical protein
MEDWRLAMDWKAVKRSMKAKEMTMMFLRICLSSCRRGYQTFLSVVFREAKLECLSQENESLPRAKHSSLIVQREMV